MSAEISDNFAQVAAQYQESLEDVKPALSDRAGVMRSCHCPHFCAKFALSASRSDGGEFRVMRRGACRDARSSSLHAPEALLEGASCLLAPHIVTFLKSKES